jgi:hypothetical protein
MKIEFARTGGFGGIRLTTDLDTSALPADQATELERLVHEANFFEMPDPGGTQRGVPDSLEYRLTISSGEEKRTLVASEMGIPAQLLGLLRYLTFLAKQED